MFRQPCLSVSEATSAKRPTPLSGIQESLGAPKHFHNELLRSADALLTHCPALEGVPEVTLERTEGVHVERLQRGCHRRCQKHKDDVVSSSGLRHTLMSVDRRAIQQQDKMRERLHHLQSSTQLTHDPDHQLDRVPRRLPPQKDHVNIVAKLVDHGLGGPRRDMMLVEQHDKRQAFLNFNVVRDECYQRAVMPPLSQGPSLFSI